MIATSRGVVVAHARTFETLAALAAVTVLLLGGCGGGDGEPSPPVERPATLVAALGDSITAGSPAWDPDPGVRSALGTGADPESQYEYWAQLALGRGVGFRNCGVNGERTDQIALRLDRCARGADVLVVQGGINDIAQGRPWEDASRNLESMVARGKKLGLAVVIVELLPWNNGGRTEAYAISQLNRAIHRIGRRAGVPVLPWHDALADRRDPSRMREDLTSDGDHPSVKGYRKLGELVELPAH